MITHKHHIIPKYAGGSDHPDNLIELSIIEHAEAHRLLWERDGRKEDYIAWKLLSGQSSDPTLWLYMSSLGGKHNKDKKFCYNPETGEVKKYTSHVPDGWVAGRNPATFNRTRLRDISHDATGSRWYHNPDYPSEVKMIFDKSDVPSNWVIGRSNSHITEHNKTRGYRWWYNITTGSVTTAAERPEGDWVPGTSPERNHSHLSGHAGNRKGSRWYHNPKNPIETKMIKPGEPVPSEWKLGRPKH